MRLRRRVAFAAPLVLVMSCGSKPEPKEPDDDDEDEETVAVAPGMIDTSHFPTHRDPPRREDPPPPEPTDCNAAGARCTSNPPPPPPREPTHNPPGPVKARIINVQVRGPDTVIVINRGSQNDVTTKSRMCVAAGPSSLQCTRNGQATIVRVTEKTTTATVKLTPDEVMQSGAVVRIDQGPDR